MGSGLDGRLERAREARRQGYMANGQVDAWVEQGCIGKARHARETGVLAKEEIRRVEGGGQAMSR